VKSVDKTARLCTATAKKHRSYAQPFVYTVPCIRAAEIAKKLFSKIRTNTKKIRADFVNYKQENSKSVWN